ncbi:STAS domain-containing protein [Couchioplanes caeruleus]|uniref:STAS domain-containing protein n=1 Tax=Couchioplanes caeruleus TaxID=56438 RepID=UPI0008FF354B|nr:STAS domain-containing protein [Couchioplanes caeruleus]
MTRFAPTAHTATARVANILLTVLLMMQELLNDAVRTAEIVTVDVGRVRFIDSTVISALVAARNTANHIGCRFILINPAARVRRILQITGVLDIMTDPRADQVQASGLPGGDLDRGHGIHRCPPPWLG